MCVSGLAERGEGCGSAHASACWVFGDSWVVIINVGYPYVSVGCSRVDTFSLVAFGAWMCVLAWLDLLLSS